MVTINRTDLGREVYLIAEIGGNHNGSAEIAMRLVEEAAKAGAHAVKFQTYRAETLVHPALEAMPLARARYARQFDRFKSLELSWGTYSQLIDRCRELSVDFLTSPFDMEALDRLAPHMPAVKIASGDLTYGRLIDAAVATGKPVILSTGMADEAEIREAGSRIPAAQRILLHCVSVYPCPDALVNLGAMRTLAAMFPDTTIGYSDHSLGNQACLGAVALGARVIEKHFTLDTAQELGDHRLSADPPALTRLAADIRRLSAMKGDGAVAPGAAELDMTAKMRRGVWAARDLPEGHVLTEQDVTYIRPPTALTPNEVPALLGRRLLRPLAAHAPLERENLQ